MSDVTKFRQTLLAAGGIQTGDVDDRAIFSATGRLTFEKTARVRKHIWIPANQFLSATTSGSLTSGSILIDVSGSIFAGVAGSMASVTVLQPSGNLTGSPTTAFATFPVPTDADTSGSVQVSAEWTSHDTMATTGSVFVIEAGVAYLGASAAVRTAASTGASPAYNYTASGVWYSTNLGNVPSFAAADTMGLLILRHNQAIADDTGGSGIAFAGVKLTYTANSLGASSSE